MVSAVSILCMCIALFLSLLLPFIVLLILQKGRKGVFGVWVAGALGFILPQLVIRIPVLQYLGTLPAFQQFAKGYPYFYIFGLALTAGLFETAGRLLVLKVALAKRLSYITGLASGAGHGGIEAIIIVGLTYVNNLVISIFINTGNLSTIIPNDPALAENVRQSLLNTSPELFLMAGFERVFSMMFHIAMSILLTLFIMKKRAVLGFFLVAFLHFATDFSVGLMQIQRASSLAIEGVVFGIALVSLVLAIKIRPFFGESLSIPIDPGEQAVKEGY